MNQTFFLQKATDISYFQEHIEKVTYNLQIISASRICHLLQLKFTSQVLSQYITLLAIQTLLLIPWMSPSFQEEMFYLKEQIQDRAAIEPCAIVLLNNIRDQAQPTNHIPTTNPSPSISADIKEMSTCIPCFLNVIW